MPLSTPISATPPAPAASPVILLPGERFFVRRIQLAADSPIPAQVELAVEAISPFALEHLYFGYVPDEARRHALVYAAYRRNFSAQEQSAWAEAKYVLPAFLLWTQTRRLSPGGQSAQVRASSAGLEGVAWDDASELPAVVLCRSAKDDETAEAQAALIAELAQRSPVPPDAIAMVTGEMAAALIEKDGLAITCGAQASGTFTAGNLATADVRDKQVLVDQRRAAARTRHAWRTFATAVTALAACLVLELALGGGRLLLARKRQALAARAPEVGRIESAQNLAARLEKMSAQQLRPFEMLAAINQPRPASVEFLRVSTNGPLKLSVEAQTANAGDLRTYETALHQVDGIQDVELRDPRMRDGRTSFSLEVSFKPGWLKTGGGA
jgi:hypothetical protein